MDSRKKHSINKQSEFEVDHEEKKIQLYTVKIENQEVITFLSKAWKLLMTYKVYLSSWRITAGGIVSKKTAKRTQPRTNVYIKWSTLPFCSNLGYPFYLSSKSLYC